MIISTTDIVALGFICAIFVHYLHGIEGFELVVASGLKEVFSYLFGTAFLAVDETILLLVFGALKSQKQKD